MSDTDAGKVNLGKGRPTPKRKDAQGRRTGPVAPPPTSKREAAKRLRERQARDRAAGKGPVGERMLARDQGPVRAMVRDVIDGRRNLVLLVLPVLAAFVIAGFSENDAFLRFVTPFYFGALLAIVFDFFAIRKVITARLAAEFPDDTQKGHVRYGIMRAISFRRMRVPAPRVVPGPLFRRRAS